MKSILSKKNKTLKLFVLVMVLAMSMMAFASCGGGGGEESAEPAETSDTITITDHADRQVEVPTDIQRIAVRTGCWVSSILRSSMRRQDISKT